MRSGFTREDLADLKGIEFAEMMFEVVKDVTEYIFFSRIQGIGITTTPTDLPYTKALLFSWIKDGLESGRKT